MSVNQVSETFTPVLDRLTALTVDQLVAYRLGIGEVILNEFFDGDPEKFSDRSRFKGTRFTTFLQVCRARLDDLGMSEGNLRESVRVYVLFLALDQESRARLPFSHLVVLTRVADPATRRLLANAAADHGWSVAQVRAAVARVKQGDWPDQDPNTLGLQPEEPKAKPVDRPTRAPTATAIRGARPQAREVRRVRTELKRTERVLGTVIVGLKALKAGGWEGGPQGEELRGLVEQVARMLGEIGEGVR
jgi:hypothetical protein